MKAIRPGSFEYLEAKIRRDATGTRFGRDFEWICKLGFCSLHSQVDR
jgi:hypothetical protein